MDSVFIAAVVLGAFLFMGLDNLAEAGEKKAAKKEDPTVALKPLSGTKVYLYKTVDDMPLQLHVFFPKDHDKNSKNPAIVLFFGGGWVGGSPGHLSSQARYLCKRGMVAICAEYRTKKRHGTDPFVCPEDGKSAMRWVRAHAGELGIDPDMLAAGGGSAGGHVAASTAFLKSFDAKTDDTSVSSVPNALVLYNPVIDTTEKGYGYQRLGDRKEEMSPVHHVYKGAPPTIIFHGEADTTVPFENVKRFKEKMLELGNRCELVSYPGKAHGFFNRGRPDYKSTLIGTDKFLASLGYIKGEPTIKE